MIDLRHGDSLTELLGILRGGGGSIFDAIISDPPYGTTSLAYDRAPLPTRHPDFWPLIRQATHDTAPIILFSAQPFTTELIVSNRKEYRYELIWEKNRPTGFLDANRRPLRSHENILLFCRKPKSSYYAPQFMPGKPYTSDSSKRRFQHYNHHKGCRTVNSGTRHPRSVLHFSSASHNGHPNAKPLELMRWLVRSYTRPGALVCDPFAGSGTTAMACLMEGRRFIGWEKDKQYFDLAQQRLREAQDNPITQGK